MDRTASSSNRWLAAGVLLAAACGVRAQTADTLTYDADEAPKKGQLVRPGPLPESLGRLFPDLPWNFKETITFKSDGFSMTPGLVTLVDFSEFDQDADSVRQLGIQESAWETRAVRLILRGHIGEHYKVNYLWSVEYNDLKFLDTQLWQIPDLAFSFPLSASGRTRLAVGKMKEAFAYEMVGDAANLPHQERILNPFFQARNIGAQLTHVSEDQHSTFRAGVFNDSRFETGTYDEGDWQVATRATHLLLDEPEKGRYLHLGVAGRYFGATADALRYRARPASNVTSNFLDTGTFSADHAWHAGVEFLWNEGPFSLLAEFNQAWVTSGAAGDPTFFGGYLTAGWVLTGESRPYDRTVGYARRVMPKGRWGAPELIARMAHLDLSDARAQGGELDRLAIGLNWWATRRWKLGVEWGRSWVDRDAINSTTDAVLARMQWVF